MFPTYVGMNRVEYPVVDRAMFPTYVGMNRICQEIVSKQKNVPHIRGDEPETPQFLPRDT